MSVGRSCIGTKKYGENCAKNLGEIGGKGGGNLVKTGQKCGENLRRIRGKVENGVKMRRRWADKVG